MNFETAIAKRIAGHRDVGRYWGSKGGQSWAGVALLTAAIVVLAGAGLVSAAKPVLMLFDQVDIGNVASEANGHGFAQGTFNNMGWSRVIYPNNVPGTPDEGNYGGVDFPVRVTWGLGDDGTRSAWVTLHGPFGPPKVVRMHVLDGIADDSFEVWGNGVFLYTYTSDPSTAESWVWHTISLSPLSAAGVDARHLTLQITALGDAWAGFGTYGQLAVHTVELWGFQQPTRVLLGFKSWEPSFFGPDVGSPTVSGWSALQTTSPAHWGYPSATGSADPSIPQTTPATRTVWEPPTPSEGLRTAEVTFDIGMAQGKWLVLSVLDGEGEDDFEVWVNGILVYSYDTTAGSKLAWVIHEVDLGAYGSFTGTVAVVIKATGPDWLYFAYVGQVAVNYIELLGKP